MREIQGVICAMVTPFGPSGELDEARLRQHIEFQLAASVDGLMFTGGSGEFTNLTDAERKRVVEVAVEQVNSRAPVIVGLLSPSTRHVVELARHAKTVGADALLVLPPFYINPTPAGIYEHFYTIAEQGGLPIVAYNNPGRTKVNLDAAIVARLSEIDAIVALKDCERDLSGVSEKIQAAGARITVLSGEDDLAFPTLMLGAHGGIWAGVNVVPEVFVDMYRATKAGDIGLAREIHFRLLPFIKSWYIVNHPAPLKEAMAMSGLPVGAARNPLQAMTAQEGRVVRAALDALGARV